MNSHIADMYALKVKCENTISATQAMLKAVNDDLKFMLSETHPQGSIRAFTALTTLGEWINGCGVVLSTEPEHVKLIVPSPESKSVAVVAVQPDRVMHANPEEEDSLIYALKSETVLPPLPNAYLQLIHNLRTPRTPPLPNPDEHYSDYLRRASTTHPLYVYNVQYTDSTSKVTEPQEHKTAVVYAPCRSAVPDAFSVFMLSQAVTPEQHDIALSAMPVTVTQQYTRCECLIGVPTCPDCHGRACVPRTVNPQQ